MVPLIVLYATGETPTRAPLLPYIGVPRYGAFLVSPSPHTTQPLTTERGAMAKKRTSMVVRLMSQAGTGYFYTLRRAIKANQEKCAPCVVSRRHEGAHWCQCTHVVLLLLLPLLPPLLRHRSSLLIRFLAHTCAFCRLQLLKYDPRVRAHVLFKEEKIKK